MRKQHVWHDDSVVLKYLVFGIWNTKYSKIWSIWKSI